MFSLRSDWRAPDGKTAAGGLYSFDFQRWVAQDRFDAVEDDFLDRADGAVGCSVVGAGTRDRLFVSLIDNARGRVMSFARTDGGWTSTRVALPDNGDIAINHAESYGTSISFSYTDFLTPPSIVWSDDDGVTLHTIHRRSRGSTRRPMSLAEQFVATSKDGTKIPISSCGAKTRPAPRRRCSMAMAAGRVDDAVVFRIHGAGSGSARAMPGCWPISGARESAGLAPGRGEGEPSARL